MQANRADRTPDAGDSAGTIAEEIDVLLPTCERLGSLIMTLAGIAGQTERGVRVVLSDQSRHPVSEDRVVRTLSRIIEERGGQFEWHRRLPSRGIAEQRDFLLGCSRSRHVLYLDDDVFMEPWVLAYLSAALDEQGCGFVGAFPAGLSFRHDHRPDQEAIEFWQDRVLPERLVPEGPGWERWNLHRAANSHHIGRRLPPGQVKLYKVAWVASCILYDRDKLLEVGGFSFWDRLPRYHSGEEVLVQNLLMRRWGGCAILPSGTYYSELPSTVLNDEGTVDGHALDLLEEMVDRHVPLDARNSST